jgi:hypothetical protein
MASRALTAWSLAACPENQLREIDDLEVGAIETRSFASSQPRAAFCCSQLFQLRNPAMTNDGQKTTKMQHVEPPKDGGKTEAKLGTDNYSEVAASSVWTNWAWANSRSGYDWMDSHFLFTDVV